MQKTELVMILDSSGSMDPLREETIQQFNKFLEEQQALPGEANLTLVQFANQRGPIVGPMPLVMMKGLSKETYKPCGGTALLDALGVTISERGERLRRMPVGDRPQRVVVAIITDGEENASKLYNIARIREMILHQTEKYQWDFLFLASNLQDVEKTALSYGLDLSHVAAYGRGLAGQSAAYNTFTHSVTSARSGGSTALLPEDRESLNSSIEKDGG